MRKSKVASWIVIGMLAVGGGVALAETAPENPEVVGDVVTPEVEPAPAPAPEVDEEEAKAPAVKDDEADDEAPKGEHPDNHGAVVSAAAHDHSHDEACGNHGKVVSAVAKTGELPECAGGPAAAESAKAKGQGKPTKKK